MNTLKVFTAFSGYDSQCMALDRLGIPYELVGWSEIDKYAIQAHNAIYPQWSDRNFGDISKINWQSVPDFDLFTYSFPCATKDSLILTKDGYKKLGDLQLGELVMANDGKFYPITKLYSNGVHKTCLVNALGFENIHVTYNHKFLIRTMSKVWHNDVREYKRHFSEPNWKELKDITTKDYFGIPVNEVEEFPKWNGTIDNRWGHGRNVNTLTEKFENPSFWYLMGRYVGDGWRRESTTGSGIVISCGGRNEQELVDAIHDCGYKFTKNEERTENKYIISSNELFEFVERYGKGAINKRIDGETMNLPVVMLSSFVDGLLHSDGCFVQNEYKYCTISRELIYGFAFCINKVYNMPCRISHTKRKPTVVIECRTCNQHDTYQAVFHKEPRKQDKAFYEDGYIWFPFKKAVEAEEENVYNIEVDEQHSYIMQGCISKNCTDISNAGLQKGLKEGSGTRSGLLWECAKAIEAKHPEWLLMENVKALASKKFMPDFQRWLDYLKKQGYDTKWTIMNAKDYGVPQNRERVFAVSRLCEHIEYQFPHKIELTTCMQDLLEDNVDESYYISDEKLDNFQFDEKFNEEYERIKEDRNKNQ